MIADRSIVPCNGCTACCQGEVIMLLPERGDVVDSYLHEVVTLPLSGTGPVLRKVDGHCVYLVDGACSIWDRAPVICKAFDCRKFYLSRSRAERRRMVRDGRGGQEVMKAGAARLATLTEAEREASQRRASLP